MIGTRAELEQAGEGPAGVQVLAAVDEVVGHEQRLGRHEAVGAEREVPAAHQPGWPAAASACRVGDVGRAGVEPERGDPGGDRARRHDEHLVAVAAHLGDLVAELGDGRVVDAPRASVTDDVPILATTLMAFPRRAMLPAPDRGRDPESARQSSL